MITISNELKNAIAKYSRNFQLYFLDDAGNSHTITKADFTFPHSPTSLKFGAVSSASITCDVLNSSLQKNQIVSLIIKESSVDEPINLCKFKITEAKKLQGIGQRITAYDRINFIKLKSGKVYSSTGQKTISTIWADMCSKIDNVGFSESPNYSAYSGTYKDVVVDSSLFSGYNIRDAMSYLASYIGANIVTTVTGRFMLKEFTVYKDYDLLNYNRISEPTLDEADTIISYLVAKKSNEETLTAGSTIGGSGIVFTNPIINDNALNSVINNLPIELKSYRVANISYALGDPTIRGGDIIPLFDADDELIAYIPVMEIKYTFDGGLSCTINSNKPDQNESLTLAEKINFSIKDTIDSKIYAQAAIDFSKSMSEGLGMYTSEIVDSTGATTFYTHDNIDLEKSTRIWKITSNGIGYATSWQGDDTVFVTGVNAEGNIITNMLSVYKINADMIDAKAITSDKIDTNAITSDKIRTGAITSDKIDVDDLQAVAAKIGEFKIGKFTLYRPSEPSSDQEENFNFGFGLSGTTYAFYAGYQSNSAIYNPEATYPGSPYEQDGTFKRDLVNLYIHRNGTLGAKNIELYNNDYSNARGGFKLIKGTSNTYIRTYANQIGYDEKGKEYVKNVFSHTIYTEPQNNNRTGKEYQHEFNGRVLFNDGIIISDDTDNGTFIDSARYNMSTTYTLNNIERQVTYRGLWVYKDGDGVPTAVSLGRAENGVDVRIYAGDGKAIRMMNDVYIRNNTGIYCGVGTQGGSTLWRKMLYCTPGVDEYDSNATLNIGDESSPINTYINARTLVFNSSGCRSYCKYYVFENAINFEIINNTTVSAVIPRPEGGVTVLDVLKYDENGLHLGNSSTNIYAYGPIYSGSGTYMIRYTSSGNLVIGDFNQSKATYLRAATGSNIRCESSMRFISGIGISLASDTTNEKFAMALYRSVSDTDLQGKGVYVGTEDVPLRLRGDIYSTKSAAPILRITNSNNLVLGDSTQVGNTYISANSFIRCNNNVRITQGNGLYLTNNANNSENSWLRVLYYAQSSEIDGEGIYVGADSKNLYLRGETVETEDLSVNGVLTADEMFTLYSATVSYLKLYDHTGSAKDPATVIQWNNIDGDKGVHIGLSGQNTYYWGSFHRFFSTLRVPSISFNVNGTWRAAAQYGNKEHNSGEIRTGFHFGIATFNTYIWGTPFLSNGVSITSDANLKHSIENLTDNYEKLFYSLKAKTFKYNDGTSDRTHLGFIAQDVKEAIDNSGLTTQDVAAYVADINQTDGSELLALRYSEFVALNTHMIQKCLAKISSLEDEIKLLKETINNG